jgi:small subunit ribosomal protein S16
MVKIRLARVGRLNKPLFTIVATDSRNPRGSGIIEKLGQYDPRGKELLKNVKIDAIKSYLQKGAHISDTVRTLFNKNNIK